MAGVPDGYVYGPAAATAATAMALARVADPAAMILVEGVSDQIALDAVAHRAGIDLAAERVAVVPIGGAQAIARFRREYPAVPAVAVCDRAERAWFERVLGVPAVFVCTPDLEGELIRAVGPEQVVDLVAAHGDGRALATLQHQTPWRDRPLEQQLRRFFGAGAGRKLRYASVLGDAAARAGRAPAAIVGALHAATGAARSGGVEPSFEHDPL